MYRGYLRPNANVLGFLLQKIMKVCLACHKEIVKKSNYSYKYWEEQRYCSLKCSGTLMNGKKQTKVSRPLSKNQKEVIQAAIDRRQPAEGSKI